MALFRFSLKNKHEFYLPDLSLLFYEIAKIAEKESNPDAILGCVFTQKVLADLTALKTEIQDAEQRRNTARIIWNLYGKTHFEQPPSI